MKTIEEKAKAYDEIIERAKTMLAAVEVMYGKENNASQLITDIIPELRESEDERIRKKMIEHFRSKTKDKWCNMPVKDIIAYLEKQKGNSLSLVDAWKEMRTEVFAQASGNKPKPESDEFTKLFSLNDIDFLISDLDSRGIKPKPVEWSEEDEKMLKWLEDILSIADADLSDKLHGEVHAITDSVYSSMKLCIAKCRSWLNNLRPSWKPSRAQMSMLLAVINEPNNASSESCHLALAELYEELKKLCQ